MTFQFLNEILKHTLKPEALYTKIIELPFIYLLIVYTQIKIINKNKFYFRQQNKIKIIL